MREPREKAWPKPRRWRGHLWSSRGTADFLARVLVLVESPTAGALGSRTSPAAGRRVPHRTRRIPMRRDGAHTRRCGCGAAVGRHERYAPPKGSCPWTPRALSARPPARWAVPPAYSQESPRAAPRASRPKPWRMELMALSSGAVQVLCHRAVGAATPSEGRPGGVEGMEPGRGGEDLASGPDAAGGAGAWAASVADDTRAPRGPWEIRRTAVGTVGEQGRAWQRTVAR